VRVVPALLLLVLAVHPAWAASPAELCARLEAQPGAPYLVRLADGTWQLLARRSATEPAKAAIASAKASLATHLAKGSEQPVSWSGATWQGPVRCNGFSAVLLTVPAASITVGAAPVAARDISEAEVTQLNERRMLGQASAADLLRLAAYYQWAGDSEQAAQLAAQASTNK
jgi:hypothetical protein